MFCICHRKLICYSISSYTCRKAYMRLGQQVDESKFCAGGIGGEGVCYGDSGGKIAII